MIGILFQYYEQSSLFVPVATMTLDHISSVTIDTIDAFVISLITLLTSTSPVIRNFVILQRVGLHSILRLKTNQYHDLDTVNYPYIPRNNSST
jgi:hypothetical protein